MINKIGQFFHDKFRKNESKLHQLTYLFWECTLRCNLSCLHCGSDCKTDSFQKDIPFEDFLNAILPLKEKYPANSITIVITGGEPLLRKDLSNCGKKLREHGFRWGIVTNGFAYDEAKHAQLLSAGMGAVTLSLDGLEEHHNWLRNNKKSFSKAVRALELITSSKRLYYDVVTCVNTRNINKLEELKDFLVAKNVKAWRLFTIAPIGRAANNKDFCLRGPQIKYLMGFIANSKKEKKIDVNFSCEAYVGKYEKKIRDSYFFCRAGIQIASVLIDGSVSACPNINKCFVQGDIYTDSFIDIWENRFEIMRNREWTKTGKCFQCKDYMHCNGGAMHLWDNAKEDILICLNNKMNIEGGEK